MPLNAYFSIFVAFYEVPLKSGLNVMYKDAAWLNSLSARLEIRSPKLKFHSDCKWSKIICVGPCSTKINSLAVLLI